MRRYNEADWFTPRSTWKAGWATRRSRENPASHSLEPQRRRWPSARPLVLHGIPGIQGMRTMGPEESYSAASAALKPGRYLDLGEIARGGMGEIRRIQDNGIRRTVAMKYAKKDGALIPLRGSKEFDEILGSMGK